MAGQLGIEAEVLWVGFQAGYFEKADIENWADRHIDAIDVPPDALLELSILRSTDEYAVLDLLGSLGSKTLGKSEHRYPIGFLGVLFLEKRISLESAIRSLFWIGQELSDDVPEGLSACQQRIYLLDHNYDDAVGGFYGTIEAVEADAIDFLTPYAAELQEKHPDLLALRND